MKSSKHIYWYIHFVCQLYLKSVFFSQSQKSLDISQYFFLYSSHNFHGTFGRIQFFFRKCAFNWSGLLYSSKKTLHIYIALWATSSYSEPLSGFLQGMCSRTNSISLRKERNTLVFLVSSTHGKRHNILSKKKLSVESLHPLLTLIWFKPTWWFVLAVQLKKNNNNSVTLWKN